MEYMKALHLILFVSKLDLSNLYGVGGIIFCDYIKITFSCGGAKFVYSLIPIPTESFFPVVFPFDVCLKATTYIKHVTKKVLKVY